MKPVRRRYKTIITTEPWGYAVMDEQDEPVEIYDRGEKTRLVFVESEAADAFAAALNLGAGAIESSAFDDASVADD